VSVKITSLVWKYGPADHAQFVAELALAEFADNSGLCWPSVETIAARSRVSKRNTIRALKDLEAGDWISIQRKSHERKGNTYHINLKRLASSATVSPVRPKSDASMTPDVTGDLGGCAAHCHRPDLSMDEARKLMTREGVYVLIGALGIVNATASQEDRNRLRSA
jgi:hypothetical protein